MRERGELVLGRMQSFVVETFSMAFAFAAFTFDKAVTVVLKFEHVFDGLKCADILADIPCQELWSVEQVFEYKQTRKAKLRSS